MSNLPAKKYQKTSPTVTRLAFFGTGGATQFIDIARALSIINRKMYRQGVYYYVNSVEAYNNSNGVIDIHTVPDSWVTRNAWKRGFRTFQKMNALVDTPRPKYHDFKVHMTNLHRTTGTLDPIMLGTNGIHATMHGDEWAYSQFTSADDDGDSTQEADNFVVHMVGTHVNSAGGQTDNGNWESIGLIKSYAETRAEPDQSGSPIIPANADVDPLNNLFDFSSEEMLNDIINNLDEDNDQTPYDADLYVGEVANHMQHVARLATTNESGRVVKGTGFCAPFGLIMVDPSEIQGDDNYRIVINLAVGTYNGVYAERV